MGVLLVTSIEITKSTPIGGNVDVDSYAAVIEESQDFVIEPILGTKLIEKIKEDYDNGDLAGHYLTIRENYLKSILAYSVAGEFFLFSNFQSRNGGTFKNTPQNGEAISKEEADFLANKMKAKADVYIQRLQRFLCDRDSEIPEYTQDQDEDFDIDPDRSVSTFGGWYLGRSYYKGSNAMREIYKDIYHDEGQG